MHTSNLMMEVTDCTGSLSRKQTPLLYYAWQTHAAEAVTSEGTLSIVGSPHFGALQLCK